MTVSSLPSESPHHHQISEHICWSRTFKIFEERSRCHATFMPQRIVTFTEGCLLVFTRQPSQQTNSLLALIITWQTGEQHWSSCIDLSKRQKIRAAPKMLNICLSIKFAIVLMQAKWKCEGNSCYIKKAENLEWQIEDILKNWRRYMLNF